MVHECERQEKPQKFQVIELSHKLLEHSFIILSNRKHFPALPTIRPNTSDTAVIQKWYKENRERDIARLKIQQVQLLLTQIDAKLCVANSTTERIANNVKYRILLEQESLECLQVVIYQINDICKSFHIRADKMAFWLNIAQSLRTKLKGWIKMEYEKGSSLISEGKFTCSESQHTLLSQTGDWFNIISSEIA